MRTFIVATDFSEEAQNAMEYAGGLAREMGAGLILFNSFSLPVHMANSLLPAEAIYKMKEDNRLLLQERAEQLAAKYDIEVTTKSGFFLMIEEGLDELFFETGADLVIMGMAAKSIEQDLFGNTTTSVILKLKYPVLAIPRTAKFSRVKKILFACENLQKLQPAVRNKIKELATQLKSKVEIFHVVSKSAHQEPVGTGFTGLDDFEEISYSWKNSRADNVVKGIEKEIKSSKADLLIMVPQHYSFWEGLIYRSKTRVMASGLSIPLLSIPQ